MFFLGKNKPQKDLLLEEIDKTKLALDSAYSNFENVVDPDLIDCCIFELNSIQKRYKFLLKIAKSDAKYYTNT